MASIKNISFNLDNIINTNLPRNEKKLGMVNPFSSTEAFYGGVFKTGDNWIEYWQSSDMMLEMTMLQIVVDEADESAEFARARGVSMKGLFVSDHVYGNNKGNFAGNGTFF